ncbi:MAG: NAD-dependent epimerase/dehydratase family protein [Phycisphaera sp. TMED9]|nr:MAG: NAD-dependent epimerase/dehydratase family protein [Phycisphaera sp. TMED9]
MHPDGGPLPDSEHPRLRVAIAGASGFVGRALRKKLAARFEVIGLTRRPSSSATTEPDSDGVEWRQCDLFDPESIEKAIAGADVVIYLVHSMSPQSRLTQARFDDLDLLLADNMRRAMDVAGTRHVVFLGGLGADQDPSILSRHLVSRQEVGAVLGGGNARLTELRAGLVIGRGGSSFRMLIRLIRRLPVMVLPRWTSTPTQPVAINDIERAFEAVLEAPEKWEGEFDLGIDEEMTYGQMIHRAGVALGRDPFTVPVPISSPRVSTLWIMLFSGEPGSLVIPLIASLKTPTIARSNPLLDHLGRDSFVGFDESVRDAIEGGGADDDPRRVTRRGDRKVIQERSLVRSIQRMPMPENRTPSEMAREYWEWLGRVFRPLLRIKTDLCDDGIVQRVSVCLFGKFRMLELARRTEACDDDVEVLAIEGGMLVRRDAPRGARLEFRAIRQGGMLLTVLQEYAPSLPWPVYLCSQARLHLIVMLGFRRWLRRKA